MPRMQSLRKTIGKGYGAFWHTKKRYRVVKGGRGSKKSATAALWYIANTIKHPLANTLVVRKTFNTHKDSTYAKLQWAAHTLGVYHLFDWKTSPLEITYRPTGQKILFRGFDDPHKLTSITVPIGVLCWVWVEEAFEIDDEEEFKTLDESIRGEMPDGLWKQLTLTFNPWVDSHWTKTRFFDNDDPDAFTLTTTYKCNEWLDDGDRKLIEDQEESNPERFKVVGLGEYGLPGGTFFEEFRRDIHVCEPFEIPKHWRRFRAIDYGFDMLAVAWFAVDQEKRLWLYRELYESGLTLKEAAARIQQMTPEGEKIDYTVASPDLWNRNKDTGVPEVETLKKAGLMNLRKADDRRVPGWRQVREYLKPYQVGEYKRADLVIWDCCKNAIRTLAAICKDKVNPEDCADEPHEITHMPEAIRYGVMSRPPKAVAPKKKPGLFSPAWMDAQIQEHARW